MNTAFQEVGTFTVAIPEYFGSDDAYFALQDALIADPNRGAVIPGTGGLRKVRWPHRRRGKGKRGGLRVIYMHIPAARPIIFFDVYDKNEADDLSSSDKRYLSGMAAAIRAELEREGGWYE